MDGVQDTPVNAEICGKYCGACPTYKRNFLARYGPGTLFCARGTSLATSKVKTMGCFCPACELFTEHSLVIGYFCAKK
ncbi:MAG: hypothetical protein A4E35_00779 [Methanoregula sp. PtaU1.Bin051]|nr:MAG: hypothetical protein A4E35_00779 [Methanoregula sp. PtaU1.Bin051]